MSTIERQYVSPLLHESKYRQINFNLVNLLTKFLHEIPPNVRAVDVIHTFSRFGAIASISSMNIIAGEFFSASSKAKRQKHSNNLIDKHSQIHVVQALEYL